MHIVNSLQQCHIHVYTLHYVSNWSQGAILAFLLEYLDFIKGVSPEYMHCAILGVLKLLMDLWMDADQCCHIIAFVRTYMYLWLINKSARLKFHLRCVASHMALAT